MLKQCGFLYEEVVLFKRLTAWPLTVWEDLPLVLAPNAATGRVYFPLRNLSQELHLPTRESIPGRLVGKGNFKELSIAEFATYARSPAAASSIDLLILVPEHQLSEKLLAMYATALPDRKRLRKALASTGGASIHCHDGSLVGIISLKRSVLAMLYACCVHGLTPEIEASSVRKAWAALVDHAGEGQIVSGLEKTIYFRFVPRSAISCADLREFLRWDFGREAFHRAGSFDPLYVRRKMNQK